MMGEWLTHPEDRGRGRAGTGEVGCSLPVGQCREDETQGTGRQEEW